MAEGPIGASRAPVAIIPARLGSQRFPRKNLALLHGTPLICWTIQAAIAAGIFQEIIVSSESEEIKAIVASYPITWHCRPPALARDEATVDEVLREAIQDPATILYALLPTSPLRSPRSIRAAWSEFQAVGGDGLLSLVPMAPPEWALGWKAGVLSPRSPLLYESPRTRLEPFYRHDGGHYVISRRALNAHALLRRMRGWLTPAAEAVDIDTPEDLQYAEWRLAR